MLGHREHRSIFRNGKTAAAMKREEPTCWQFVGGTKAIPLGGTGRISLIPFMDQLEAAFAAASEYRDLSSICGRASSLAPGSFKAVPAMTSNCPRGTHQES